MRMKRCSLIIVVALIAVFPCLAAANQAEDTTIRITGQTAGATPFISKVSLAVSNATVLKSIQFTVTPKPGSVTRPLSGTYANSYLIERGFESVQTGDVVLPVYGLYDGYTNGVKLTFRFLDGSSKQINTSITTAAFNDLCGYKTPTILQRRTNDRDLSYDYMMLKGGCNDFQPAILDTDGRLRWVGTAGISAGSAIFFDNAAYMGDGRKLVRIDLDGAFTELADYSNLGIINFHHNIDVGKVGIILDADTTTYYNCVNIEVDASGRVLKQWNLATIISAAMIAGGDDPSQFVHTSPTDWFHNNGVAYNRADDSLIVSSRENFLICIDYQTGAIKWILGDPTKRWHQFPSLRRFALTLAPGSTVPIGQHTPSITADQNLLVLDNAQPSDRRYSSPRKYRLDLVNKVATEVWNFPTNQSIYCPFCGSVYEDAPNNYLIDYAIVNGGLPGRPTYAQLLGVNAAGETIFSYRYPAVNCGTIYRALPIHLENTKFPTVGPQPLNLSTRGNVSSGDGVLIGGFVITGTEPKTVVLRALGPSLSSFGVTGVLGDPVLKLYNSSHALIAFNDNWQSDPHNADIQKNGLAPARLLESATFQTLAPGSYTVIVSGKASATGIALVELYDLSPLSNSDLKNISTRGAVGSGNDALISGFIVGDVSNTTVIVRALGPSLARFGVNGVLSDPTLTIYDSTGTVIATNDNWRDDVNAIDVQRNGLSPPNEGESALVLHPPAGAYTAVIRGANGGTGIGLAEVYTLH
jgi:arylsulfate sulfotransferase